MDFGFIGHNKCVSSCLYNLRDDNSSQSSNSNSLDPDIYDQYHCPILENLEIPKPYIFRINRPSRTGEARNVTSPPFYLQLDHVIAVIWQLFDTDKIVNWTLGIGQLQWALYFLKAIKNPTKGTRSPDIKLAIKATEDALFECYADMASVVMRSPPPQGIPCVICNLEKNKPKSTCEVCTSASWGLLGQPRKSDQKNQSNLDTKYNTLRKFSSMPVEPLIKQEQTDAQLRNEIEQLRNLALHLSTTKPGDFKRKKVRVKTFTVLDRSHN